MIIQMLYYFISAAGLKMSKDPLPPSPLALTSVYMLTQNKPSSENRMPKQKHTQIIA